MSLLRLLARLWALILVSASVGAYADSTPYTLHSGDTLLVAVWREDALLKEVRVLPDGSITFPLVGRVEVAGLGSEEVERRIAEKLKPFIPDAVVSIVITGIEGNRVYVIGKVLKPGPVVLKAPDTTVLQALSQVGGLDRFADGNAVKVLRTTPQKGVQLLPVRLNDLLKGSELSTNVMLQPGDTILVP